MLKHRLIAGSLMAVAAGGVLIGDSYLDPYYPFLFGLALLAGFLATHELVGLLPEPSRPPLALCAAGVVATLAANWLQILFFNDPSLARLGPLSWDAVVFAFTAVVLTAFLIEMATYREPGRSVARVASALLVVAYLGLLPCFFVKLRWLPPEWSGLALTATIFVPKVGDIGAYFTGRFLGRRPFSPLLSPKKTWEGFIGGMAASVLTAVGLSFAGPLFRYGVGEAVAFGLAVGLAGVLGDLAESLIKRDCLTKDAAKSIPGFGGVLDVIDSVLFAGPVAYLWFTAIPR
ncbi:MAG TPA: phosphatidate cytidylyltransferase [Fimbriiglobus sp.]|jgi:phosphatidate cytidylyltransferase|nr:phosphatidate cytidylyltransferase [Fimbriiglobus sp.]